MKTIFILLLLFVFFSDTRLEKRSLLNDRIEILVPADFRQMDQKHAEIKYPGKNRPVLILTDESTKVNLAFSHLAHAADSNNISVYHEAFVSNYKTRFPDATWKGSGIMYVNQKKVGYLKLIINAIDQKIYNYVFYTDVDHKLMLATFNCVEKELQQWEPVAEKIVRSLRVK